MRFRIGVLSLGFSLGLLYSSGAALPISLHPDNPHYFLFRGEPTVLITSGEHYGAVLNMDFDYVKYLATLSRDKLNLTRVWTGGPYIEPQGAFNIARNTLAPTPGRFISPYARSSQPGFAGGGNKFDLTQWDAAYFKRLHSFMRHASRRGIVVEMNLFCPMYEEKQWLLSPYHPSNNVNRVGPVERDGLYTLDRHGGLLLVQELLVQKFVEELADYDNVYYEVMNEPYARNVPMNWQEFIAERIVQTEANLSKNFDLDRRRHLISLNIANNSAEVKNPHRAISIFNFHYAVPPDAVGVNYHLNKPIGDNETGFRGTNDAVYRMEAWDFLLAGGALFNHLDYSFAVGYEQGTFVYPAMQPGGGSVTFRKQMRVLRDFMNQLDFILMRPAQNVLRGVPPTLSGRALVEPGRAYAIYLRPSVVTQFSVRWEGLLQAPETGEYALHTTSNDGVRLWLDGRKRIDNWTDHGETEDSVKVSLEAGRSYPIKLEYFYNGGQAVMKFQWTPPGARKETVPASRLQLASQSGTGLAAVYFLGNNFQRAWRTRTDAQVDFAWGTGSPFPTAPASESNALQLELPAGRYRADWILPATGKELRGENLHHPGGVCTLSLPAFAEDLALLIRAR